MHFIICEKCGKRFYYQGSSPETNAYCPRCLKSCYLKIGGGDAGSLKKGEG